MNQLKRYIGILVVTALLGSILVSTPVLAEESEEIPEEEEVEVELDDKTIRSAYLILQLQSRLSQKTAEYNQIQDQMDSAKDELITVRESIDSLEEQLANLDSLISESEAKIESVVSQINVGELELFDLMEDIEMRELQLEDQKAVIGELMTLMYVKKNIYYDDDDLSVLKLLLADGSVSDVMQDVAYLNLIEQTGAELLDALFENKQELETRQAEVSEKTDLLKALEDELFAENQNLLAEKGGKETLLEETEGKEEIYQELLILSKKNQEEVEMEIEELRENIDLLDSKLAYSTAYLTDEQKEQILEIKAESLMENGVLGASEFLDLDWPVEPSIGLSAYFDDSSYVSAFGVAHNAIDIRVSHGSPVYAPADGVVYKVVYDEESIGYAYVMLAHRKGVVTVYGHVSAVAVTEGDYVQRGDILGMTGGTPGSIGAGLRTTGPHLHFEVWQDGILVDPLDYLDLTHIPIDTLRDDYLERLQEDLEEEIADIQATLEVLSQ